MIEPCIPLFIPFQIIFKVGSADIYQSILYEGAFISILSSNASKSLGSPKHMSTTNKLLTFDRRPSEPLGILPHMPISLGEKIICIDVMVVQVPMDFNLIIGCD